MGPVAAGGSGQVGPPVVAAIARAGRGRGPVVAGVGRGGRVVLPVFHSAAPHTR